MNIDAQGGFVEELLSCCWSLERIVKDILALSCAHSSPLSRISVTSISR